MRTNEGVRVEEVPSCPMCGTQGTTLYAGLRDRYWDAPGVWSFRGCSSCGHHWLDPRPAPEDVGMLYGSYFSHATVPPLPFVGDGFWPRANRGVLDLLGYRGIARDAAERRLGRLFRLVPPLWDECDQAVRSVEGPPRGTLLDLGCGNGAYLVLMRALGWTVRGVEVDPVAVGVARGLELDVIESPIEDATLPSDSHDVVTLSHVVEHVADPVRVLEVARETLTPGGTLWIITPNVKSWGHRKFGAAWFHLDPPRHLHLFSRRNLGECARRAGLRVSRSWTTGRGHLVYDGSVSVRTTGRFQVGHLSTVASMRDRWFRVFERLLVTVRPEAGEEIYVACTK